MHWANLKFSGHVFLIYMSVIDFDNSEEECKKTLTEKPKNNIDEANQEEGNDGGANEESLYILGASEKKMRSELVKFDTLDDESINYIAFDKIISQTQAMHKIINRAEKLARCDLPVLIYGQAGTGKSMIAEAIHNASSRRSNPFVAVKCAALLPRYIESDFFGSVSENATGKSYPVMGFVEQADGGTLCLDEIDALPAFIQVQLLKIIQTGEYRRIGDDKVRRLNVRVIGATSKNLTEQIRLGNFRTDLFYAISIGVMSMPSLQERKGDLIYLSNYFLRQINQASSTRSDYVPKKLSPKARNLILNYSWPGNVRELYATILRATIWNDHEKITYEDLKEALLLGIH